MSYQTDCSSCVWLGEACIAHADTPAMVTTDGATDWTIFAATIGDAVEVQGLFRAAAYDPAIVICAATDETPYVRSPFVKVTGMQNIRRLLDGCT